MSESFQLKSSPKVQKAFEELAARRRKDAEEGNVLVGSIMQRRVALKSYARATKMLFDTATERGSLGKVGLPVLYMQRHTLELMVKELLWDLQKIKAGHKAIETEDYNSPWPEYPYGHVLICLYRDLVKANREFGLVIPERLTTLVNDFSAFEGSDPTLTRYDLGTKGQRIKRQSLPATRWQALFNELVENDFTRRDVVGLDIAEDQWRIVEHIGEHLDEIEQVFMRIDYEKGETTPASLEDFADWADDAQEVAAEFPQPPQQPPHPDFVVPQDLLGQAVGPVAAAPDAQASSPIDSNKD